jgi:hypothetical protein
MTSCAQLLTNTLCKIRVLEREIGKVYVYIDRQIQNISGEINTDNEEIVYDISSNSLTGALHEQEETGSSTDISFNLGVILSADGTNPFERNSIITPFRATIIIEIQTSQFYTLNITVPPIFDESLGSSIKLILYELAGGERKNVSNIIRSTQFTDDKLLRYSSGNLGIIIDQISLTGDDKEVWEMNAVKKTDGIYAWAVR